MIFNIYIIKNTLIKAFERPIFSQDTNEELVERIQRDFRASDKMSQAKMLECVVYEAGIYDDNSGKITTHEPVEIFNIATLKEVPKNEN